MSAMTNGNSIIEKAKAQADALRASEESDFCKEAAVDIDMLATFATETANALRFLRDAFLNRHGRFPIDEATDSERLWVAAMSRAYELVGRGRGVGESEAREALQRKGVE